MVGEIVDSGGWVFEAVGVDASPTYGGSILLSPLTG
jgi:hypothetical protein